MERLGKQSAFQSELCSVGGCAVGRAISLDWGLDLSDFSLPFQSAQLKTETFTDICLCLNSLMNEYSLFSIALRK